MSAEFDGLRAILGNTAATVPVLDAPAVEEQKSESEATPPIESLRAEPSWMAGFTPAGDLPLPSPSAAPVVDAAVATEDFDLQSTPHAVADIPGLSELDRGLENGDVQAHPDERDNASLDALGDGLDDISSDVSARAIHHSVGDRAGLQHSPPPVAKPAPTNAPLFNDPESLEVDQQVFAGAATRARQAEWPRQPQVPSSRNEATDRAGRRISAWTVVALVASCVVLGATAAAAVFHDDVAQIIASWGTAARSHTARLQ